MSITTTEHKNINKAYELLIQSVDNISWGYSDAEKLQHQTLQESKDHNRGRQGTRMMSVLTESKYFAVKRVIECLNGYTPNLSDYWRLQRSMFGAYALVHGSSTSELISKMYQDNKELFDTVAAYDYVKLMERKSKMKIYTVKWINNGSNYSARYYTDYHAEQFKRALELNGIENVVIELNGV